MKLLVFDFDSTLSSLEGIDELARDAGPEVFAEVEALTRRAMEGKIPLEDVFRRRLELIRPNRGQLDTLAERYMQTLEPDAAAVVALLRAAGWTPAVVSGGLEPAVRPAAAALGIEWVEAVPIYFHADGSYAGFDAAFPTARSGGKPELLRGFREQHRPRALVMVGDGGSDLETRPVVDLFVGFGRYADRPNVRAGAEVFLMELAALPELLAARFPEP
jgi:phosphoserine phosphatase